MVFGAGLVAERTPLEKELSPLSQHCVRVNRHLLDGALRVFLVVKFVRESISLQVNLSPDALRAALQLQHLSVSLAVAQESAVLVGLHVLCDEK